MLLKWAYGRVVTMLCVVSPASPHAYTHTHTHTPPPPPTPPPSQALPPPCLLLRVYFSCVLRVCRVYARVCGRDLCQPTCYTPLVCVCVCVCVCVVPSHSCAFFYMGRVSSLPYTSRLDGERRAKHTDATSVASKLPGLCGNWAWLWGGVSCCVRRSKPRTFRAPFPH